MTLDNTTEKQFSLYYNVSIPDDAEIDQYLGGLNFSLSPSQRLLDFKINVLPTMEEYKEKPETIYGYSSSTEYYENKTKLNKTRQELNETREKLKDALQKLEDREEELEHMERAFENSWDELILKEGNLEEKISEIEEGNETRQELENELKAVREEKQRVQENLTSVRNEREEVQEELSNVRDRLGSPTGYIIGSSSGISLLVSMLIAGTLLGYFVVPKAVEKFNL